MRFYEFTTPIDEKASTGGLEYEKTVASVLQQILPQFKDQAKFVSLDCGTAGFCAFGVDLELDVGGKDFNVEIKQSKLAQMGGTSIRYNPDTDTAEIVNADTIDDESKPYFISAAKSKKDEIIAWIDTIKQQEPAELHANLPYKFPVAGVTKEAWGAAVASGALKALNDKVRFSNTNLIATAYNKKNVFYIQIGGAGLFFLNKNPYNLPIPQFEGEIDIEFRLGPSGSKSRNVAGKEYRVVGASYRCQGRLKTSIKSNMSLDNPEQAIAIIKHIIDLNSKTPSPPPETTKSVQPQQKSPDQKLEVDPAI